MGLSLHCGRPTAHTTMPILPARTPRSRFLRRISGLLWVVVVALIIAFCYFASSFCITIILATFLSILVDPLVSRLERFRVPRVASAVLIILGGMLALAMLAYASYGRFSDLVDNAPMYADRVREILSPITRKIARVEETAGRLDPAAPQPQPAQSRNKRVQEVKVQQAPTWPSYLVRGLGSVSSIVLIAGVVPFLMYFMLIRKEKWYLMVAEVLGPKNNPLVFSQNLAVMVQRFALSNFLVGLVMSAATGTLLYALKLDGAWILGLISGFLNLVPFLGALLAVLVPLAAAIIQGSPVSYMLILVAAIIFVHLFANNFIIPHFVGSRMNIGPVAATAGVLFWGWLWGIMGVLLAIPLTGLVKLIADSHPSLKKLSDILRDTSPPKEMLTTDDEAVHGAELQASNSN